MDLPRSFDQPRETGGPVPRGGVETETRLAALAAHLSAHGYTVALTSAGLVVGNASAAGCCEEVRHPSDTITCRPRGSDGGKLWFVTSWQEPIAEADRVTDAVMRIKSYLGAPS